MHIPSGGFVCGVFEKPAPEEAAKPEDSEIDDILAERQKTHGDFSGHSFISQSFKAAAHKSKNWHRLSPSHRESIDMILHKVARILNGNPLEKDHWLDIEGYAKLARKEIGGE